MISSPESSSHAVPMPPSFCSRKPSAAKDARAQRLLESDADAYLRRRAQKAVAMHQVFLPRSHLNGHDVPRHLGGERDLAGILHGAILGHKEAAAARPHASKRQTARRLRPSACGWSSGSSRSSTRARRSRRRRFRWGRAAHRARAWWCPESGSACESPIEDSVPGQVRGTTGIRPRRERKVMTNRDHAAKTAAPYSRLPIRQSSSSSLRWPANCRPPRCHRSSALLSFSNPRCRNSIRRIPAGRTRALSRRARALRG